MSVHLVHERQAGKRDEAIKWPHYSLHYVLASQTERCRVRVCPSEEVFQTLFLVTMPFLWCVCRVVYRDIGGSDPERMAAPRVAEYVLEVFKDTCVQVKYPLNTYSISSQNSLSLSFSLSFSVCVWESLCHSIKLS